MESKICYAEYIWLDGVKPTHELRSKTRIVEIEDIENVSLSVFPEWGFDGSSTEQAEGDNSDCLLRPVNFVNDPIRGEGNFLVLCEVFNANGTEHESNTRYQLRKVLEAGGAEQDPVLGFEQEYTLFENQTPLGWPDNGFPRAQGPFYCGVGNDRVYGRDLVEAHMDACVSAGLLFYGINAEVMPGQWEFQIGYRGFKDDRCDALNICDHHWLATWLLHRLGEEFGVNVSFENKPVKGDWNGAGCHTNFSTKAMRDKATGRVTIEKAIAALSEKHAEHVAVYGYKLNERLTGGHETCSIDEFKAGNSDRGASIRIPMSVAENGYGYIEDRRPGANSDPYLVSARLIATICGVDESVLDVKLKSKDDILRLQAAKVTISI